VVEIAALQKQTGFQVNRICITESI